MVGGGYTTHRAPLWKYAYGGQWAESLDRQNVVCGPSLDISLGQHLKSAVHSGLKLYEIDAFNS